MSFEIPDGLTDMLQQFVVSVLRRGPGVNVIQYAAEYFQNQLLESQNHQTGGNKSDLYIIN